MHEPKATIQTWLKSIETYEAPEWSRLPDIDLYMDQVLTYLDKHLRQLYDHEDYKLLTSSMINNYVKAHIIESPVGKKYGKDQISRLFAMSMLKRVLPINDIKTLLDDLSENPIDQHDYFMAKQQSTLSETAKATEKRITNVKSSSAWREDVAKIALDLVLEAQANSLIAEHLLKAIKADHEHEKAELEQAKKKKEDKDKKEDKKEEKKEAKQKDKGKEPLPPL